MNMKTRLYKTILCSAVTILLMTTLGSYWWVRYYYPEINRLYFQVWIKTSVPDSARLYYDIGKGLSEEHAIGVPLNSDGLFHRYRLPLPDGPIQNLRFDPLTGHGIVSIKGIEIVNGLGWRVYLVGLQQLHPVFQIKTWILNNDQVDLETDNQGNDPQITIHLNTPITTPKGLYLNLRQIGIGFFLQQIGIIFFLSLSGTLVLASLFHLWIRRNDEAIHTRLRWVWEGIILLSCIFLFIRYATGTWHHTTKFVKAWFAFL